MSEYNLKLQRIMTELEDLIEDISHYQRSMPKSKDIILEYMNIDQADEDVGDKILKRHHWKTKKLKKSLLKKGRRKVNTAVNKIKSFYNEQDQEPVEETTTSGSVATVAMPLGSGDPKASVYPKKKAKRKTKVIKR